MFAGKRATNSTVRARAATRVSGAMARPTAPAHSNTPVSDTRNPGAGSEGGTNRTRSARVWGRKCDTAVKTNIAAKPNRNAPTGVAAASNSPVTPASQKAPQATSWTISGAMNLGPQSSCCSSANTRS